MANYNQLNIQNKASENDPFTMSRYRQFYKFFPSNAKLILDIGCNTGRGGRILKELNEELVIFGIDIVLNRLKRVSRDVYDNGICCKSSHIPFDNGKFDVIVAGEFIEHLTPNDVTQTFTEIFRILKVGGRFLLTTPNPEDIKRKIMHSSILGGAHLSQHFQKALKLQLQMIGFSKIKIYGSGRVSKYLGTRFPFLSLYGSYMAIGGKI